ncbi:hypothetical protein BLNAU_25260 [Blattamonas nauphoetae]|uniref:Uncharacterized protein n=1 Tax=Blattamonas nauphoetae TaxID=2049346 RepID=A0ABQ9WKH2_9EUKA|nr:hypothetical protein BLNAU_25260 [Blattamonas nauphoetae]
MGAFISKISSSAVSPSQDCSPFLNWKEEALPSQSEAAVVFRSLVATIKLQPFSPHPRIDFWCFLDRLNAVHCGSRFVCQSGRNKGRNEVARFSARHQFRKHQTFLIKAASPVLWLETPDAPEGDEIEDDDDDRQSDLEAIFSKF